MPPSVWQGLLAALIALMGRRTQSKVADVREQVSTRLDTVEMHLQQQDTAIGLLTELAKRAPGEETRPPQR